MIISFKMKKNSLMNAIRIYRNHIFNMHKLPVVLHLFLNY